MRGMVHSIIAEGGGGAEPTSDAWAAPPSALRAATSPYRGGSGVSGREPARAIGAEPLRRHVLIVGAILGEQHVAPAAVCALVDEGGRAALPHLAAERSHL